MHSSALHTALGFGNKVEKPSHFRGVPESFLDDADGLVGLEIFPEVDAVRFEDVVDRRLRKAVALEPNDVDTLDLETVAVASDIRGNMPINQRSPTRESVGTDAQKLRDSILSAKCDIVFNRDMATESRVVSEDVVAANVAIMGDMDVAHQQVVAAQRGATTTALSASMHRNAFPEGVVVPNDHLRVLAVVLEVLRLPPDVGEGVEHVLLTNGGVASKHDLRVQEAARAELHLRANLTVRANDDIAAKYRAILNEGGGVDFAHGYQACGQVQYCPRTGWKVKGNSRGSDQP